MMGSGLRTGGVRFLAGKVRNRIEWEVRRRRGDSANGDPAVLSGLSVQSQRIGAAFYRAVAQYNLAPVPVHVSLFRPRLQVDFEFRDGRRINRDRRYVREDNYWTEYVDRLEVTEVPGDHDSMVLEPNVRVLAANVRRSLEND